MATDYFLSHLVRAYKLTVMAGMFFHPVAGHGIGLNMPATSIAGMRMTTPQYFYHFQAQVHSWIVFPLYNRTSGGGGATHDGANIMS